MSHRSRREFLITTGAGIAAGLAASTAARAQDPPGAARSAPRVRKNVVSAAAKGDLASLSKGVAEMRNLVATSASDPRGWILQAFLHGNCGGFTKCQHRNWFFAPWHRSLLYYFEGLIQHFSGDPNFALPYWDWSRTQSVPGSFYGTGNPLDDTLSIRSACQGAPAAGRGRSAAERFSRADLTTFVGSGAINRIQQNPDYATYGGSATAGGELEATPHNFVHRWVGGARSSNMVQYFSPLDPIFWLHHCNLDRLYSNWLARPGHLPPSDPTWQKKTFNDFFDRDGKPAGSEFTSGATVDSTVMGYVYDQAADRSLTRKAAASPADAVVQVVASVVASAATRRAGVLSFVSEGAPSADARRVLNATALGIADYAARLRIEGVKIPAQQNTAVHVFLGPDIAADTPISVPGYVGSYTFFEGQPSGGGAHAHEGGRSLLLNASDALRRLYGDTSLPDGASLTVSMVTRALYTGINAFGSIEEIQPDRIQLDVVNLNA